MRWPSMVPFAWTNGVAESWRAIKSNGFNVLWLVSRDGLTGFAKADGVVFGRAVWRNRDSSVVDMIVYSDLRANGQVKISNGLSIDLERGSQRKYSDSGDESSVTGSETAYLGKSRPGSPTSKIVTWPESRVACDALLRWFALHYMPKKTAHLYISLQCQRPVDVCR